MEHRTQIRALDDAGMRWLMTCDGCDWRVLIDETADTGRNYVQESVDHGRQRSTGPAWSGVWRAHRPTAGTH